MQPGDTITHQFTVTPAVYDGFLATFGDRHALHTDAGYAQTRGFRSVVMHGNILNGFLSYFVGELLPEKEVLIHAQEIRFSQPVYLHDTLDFQAEVTEVSEAVGAMIFKFRFSRAGQRVASGKIQIGRLPPCVS